MKKLVWRYLVLSVIITGVLLYWASTYFRQRNSVSLTETFFSPPASSQPVSVLPIKILFGGDLMFDRNIRLRMQEHGSDFIFETLQDTFEDYDLVLANLEGPVTDNPSRSVGSVVGSTNNFIFTFPPETITLLKKSNFKIVNLGNNHIQNFGREGVLQTRKYLDSAEIKYFGDTGLENTSDQRTLIYELKDKKLGFANYNEFTLDGWEHALADVAFLRDKVDLVIVYTHWGTEYQPTANQVIQNQAHELINAGADLVIGSHPHVTQQTEDYQGKRIYYSLGNFVFDQYFSPEVKAGLLVGVEIDSELNFTFTELPIKIESNGQTHLAK